MTSKLDEYTDEIKQRLVEGVSQNQLAGRYGVARSTLQSWLKNRNVPVPLPDSLSENPSDDYEEIPIVHRDYSDLDHLHVYPMGDVHKGSPAHAEDRWHEWLKYLETTDNVSLLCTGDLFNAAIKTSVSETYDEKLTVGESKRRLRSELRALAQAGKIDLLMPGNHDDRVYRAVGDCPVEDLADSLEIPYVRDAVLLVYAVGAVEYHIYVVHGKGAGQVGARASRLQKQAHTIRADIYVSGHTHSQLVFPQDVFAYNAKENKIVRERQLFISSGSFLNYEGYAAKSGYPPTKIGAPRIRLDGERHDPHVSI